MLRGSVVLLGCAVAAGVVAPACATGSDDAGAVIVVQGEGGAGGSGAGAGSGAGGAGGSGAAAAGSGGSGAAGAGSGGSGGEACMAGLKRCGGICVAPGPTNGCASTGCDACPPPPANASPACAGTTCGYACDPGFAPGGAGCAPTGAAGASGAGAGGSGGGPGICSTLCTKGAPLGCPGYDPAKCSSQCSALWTKFPACGAVLDAFYGCAAAQPLSSFECDPVDGEPVLRFQFCASEAFALTACVS